MTGEERSRSRTKMVRSGRESFSLEEVRRLDAEAVRACDGFEFRYHQGGTVTWLETTSSHEIKVPVLVGVPIDDWRHLEGCACRVCGRPSQPSASGPGATPPDVIQ